MWELDVSSTNVIEWLVLFAVAAVVTMLLVPVAKALATKCNAIDYPSARRVNKKPIPRMGGVAMLGGLVAALVVVLVGMEFFGWDNPFVPHSSLDVNYIGVGISVLVMFAVGLVDDIVSLNPKVKFLGQVVAACIAVASGLLLSSMRSPVGDGTIYFGWFSYPLTVFYLVAFANVINLIDGLDGLAAGITAISGFTIFLLSVMTGRPDAAVMAIALVGACVGFLRFNFYPASIFMGDSGSLLLGYSLGVVSLFAVARASAFVSLLVPLLAAGVPILDTAFAIVRRLRAHKPIDEPDKEHIHHRLMESGFSQRTTVLIMWAWTALLSICGILITALDGIARVIAIVVIVIITIIFVYKLHLLQPVLIHHYHPRGRDDDAEQVEGDSGAEGLEADAGSDGQTESASREAADVTGALEGAGSSGAGGGSPGRG